VRLSEKVGLQLQLEEQDLKAIQYVRRDAGKPSLQFFESCNITREGLAAGKQASGVSQSGGGRSLERSSRDAELVRHGIERGRREQPVSTSSGFDEIENKIVERIAAEKKSSHAIFVDELEKYSQRLSSLDFEGRFAIIRQAAPEAVAEIRAEAAQGRDELNRLRRHLIAIEDERDNFRSTHKLQRTARTSSSATKTLKIGIGYHQQSPFADCLDDA